LSRLHARKQTTCLSARLQKVVLICSIFPWLGGISTGAAQLKPETVAAFERYVRVTEARMEQEARDNQFLIVDRLPDSRRQEAYKQLQRGQIYIEELHSQEDDLPIHVPSGLIHHWAGVIFIPKATLSEISAVLQDYENEPAIYNPDIRQARLIQKNGNESKIFLQLYNKSIVTVVFNGFFDIRENPIGNTRMESASRSRRITEVVNPGGPDEHERPEGNDHGYMWRLNSYWRLEEKDGGVYVQNQSITLTRGVPVLLAWLINPLTKSIPRDVLSRMLTDTRNAVLKKQAESKQQTRFRAGPSLSACLWMNAFLPLAQLPQY
jgi:hypothetical protein